MGWIAITKDGEMFQEGDPNPDRGGRPVAKGEEGSLAVIAQEDYGHRVAVDLFNGIIAIDYESLGLQNGTVELASPKVLLWICDETNIAAELAHNERIFTPFIDEKGKQRIGEDGKPVMVYSDRLTPLAWRPIWFTRNTMGIPTKVIGAQTTLPDTQGGGNVKKMVSLFIDGRIGID